jgi:hypothetical protein
MLWLLLLNQQSVPEQKILACKRIYLSEDQKTTQPIWQQVKP